MLSVLAFVLAAAAPNADGWRAAKWGMSEEQVLAAFPGEAQRTQKDNSMGGMSITIEIPAFDIAGTEYRVSFAFDKSGALGGVNIAPNGEMEGAFHEGHFNGLADLLTEKYGQPAVGRSDDEPLQKREKIWNLPSTTITLSWLRLKGFGKIRDSELVTLSYQRPSREKDKL